MQELAQRAFRALRTIPDNCESLFSMIRKLPGRKSQGEAEVTSARRARCGRVNTKAGRQLGLNTDVDQRENKVPSGKKKGSYLICNLFIAYTLLGGMAYFLALKL